MAYTKTIWTEITAITTTLLNKMEGGIETAHNLIASISLDWASITGKPATFPPSTHSHGIPDVTGLQTALDGKSSTSHHHDAAYLGKTAKAADSDKLNGQTAAYYAMATHNHNTAYLGITAQAADSAKISGKRIFVQTTQPTATGTGDVWISY
jgi:hypothetical protein